MGVDKSIQQGCNCCILITIRRAIKFHEAIKRKRMEWNFVVSSVYESRCYDYCNGSCFYRDFLFVFMIYVGICVIRIKNDVKELTDLEFKKYNKSREESFNEKDANEEVVGNDNRDLQKQEDGE